MKREYSETFEGGKIAEQITSVMRSGEKCSSLSDFPELKDWLENDETAVVVTQKLSSAEQLTECCVNFDRQERRREVERLIISMRRKQRRNLIIKVAGSVAAALLAVTFLLTMPENSSDIGEIAAAKPMLVLGDGENVDLTVVSDRIGEIVKSENRIIYSSATKTVDTSYNTLIVPKLYTYNIELSDGTLVCLNANSELRYPVEFRGGVREVFLKGEGFFKVAKSGQPFIVKTGDVSVKVYGTQFNINSYSTDMVSTVLVEGSVGVSASGVETMMKPDQMLTVGSNGRVVITDVDVSKYTAWMSGEIVCQNEPLSSLLQKISRWYGVEFSYNDAVKNIEVTTSLSNDLPLDEVVNAIRITANVKILKVNSEKYMIE